jgi:hypothetical protein
MNEPDMTPRQLLDVFVLEQINAQPLARRALLYRAFAAETSNLELKAKVHALADECEEIERRHQQLALDFRRASL